MHKPVHSSIHILYVCIRIYGLFPNEANKLDIVAKYIELKINERALQRNLINKLFLNYQGNKCIYCKRNNSYTIKYLYTKIEEKHFELTDRSD